MCFIYKITHKINNKAYIGQTTKPLEKRWKDHLYDSYTVIRRSKFHDAIRDSFEEDWLVEIIEECSEELLNEREAFWVKLYNTYEEGYNSTPDGQKRRNWPVYKKKDNTVVKPRVEREIILKEINDSFYKPASTYVLPIQIGR